MSHIDDLPERPMSHIISDAAESAFGAAVRGCGLFHVQAEDRKDYGTDYQIEALDGGKVTNFRTHVQLKGTEADANTDGSVSFTAARNNLNYLLSQPDSIFVGFHRPTGRLLVRYASEVFREYERRGSSWHDQKVITIRCRTDFDESFQRSLFARVLATGKSNRDRRLEWAVTPPAGSPRLLTADVPIVEVPPDPSEAAAMLSALYDAGHDSAISASFARFQAVLGATPGAMDHAYMAEINLAMMNAPFDRERVIEGRVILWQTVAKGELYPAGHFYCIGNACLALEEYENAKSMFTQALALMSHDMFREMAAQVCKNLGAACEGLNDAVAAKAAYEKSLDYDPGLAQAHYALAVRLIREGSDLKKALEHLDAITPKVGSVPMSSVQARRIEVLFQLGDVGAAFREVNSLLEARDKHQWVWPFCAGQVAAFGRSSVEAAAKAQRFWQGYLDVHKGDLGAKKELVACLWMLHANGNATGISYEVLKTKVLEIATFADSDAAFFLDRLGHWAQDDDEWIEAEWAFRRAYELEPNEEYGYCLGVALNHLGRCEEALPVLLAQAQEHQPDAISWFQVGYAKSELSDHAGAIEAYQKALELDPDYDHALFNLAGSHWNSHNQEVAIQIWRDAIARFPNHPRVAEIQAVLARRL